MRQNYRLWVSSCALIVCWGSANAAIAQSSAPVSPQPSTSSIQFIPRANLSGAGSTKVGKPGGSRGNCPLLKVATKNPTLIPLVPQKIGWSATDKPTLWVYSPYLADAGVTATVVLRDVQDVSRPAPFPAIKVPLPPTPGVMQIPLPQSLEPQRLYRWYFTVNCDPKDSTNNPQANGLVGWEKPSQELQRQLATASPLQQANLYAQQGFWYDALALLAKEAPSTDWTALLKSGDPKLEAIAQEKVLR